MDLLKKLQCIGEAYRFSGWRVKVVSGSFVTDRQHNNLIILKKIISENLKKNHNKFS